MIDSELLLIFREFNDLCLGLKEKKQLEDSVPLYEGLIQRSSRLANLKDGDNINRAKKYWVDISSYVSSNFFASDSLIKDYQKTQRKLRVIKFLDSKSHVA